MKKNDYGKMLAELKNSGAGSKVDAVKLVRTNPPAAALISKLTTDPMSTSLRDGSGKIDQSIIQAAGFNAKSGEVASDIRETNIIMQMHPDMELAAQILISSVLAPKDLTTVEITYSAENANLPADIIAVMTEKVRAYMESTYKIKEELPKILRSILIDAGSYPIAVIPEASVDDLINNRIGYGTSSSGTLNTATESASSVKKMFRLNCGILGDPKGAKNQNGNYSTALESMFVFKQQPALDPARSVIVLEKGLKTNITVIDNPAVLHIPELADSARSMAVRNVIDRRVGTEDYDDQFAGIKRKKKDGVNVGTLFRRRAPDFVPIHPVLTKDKLSRRSIGDPLTIRLPPESTMPVFVPGYPENHIGYYVILDNEGNPISRQKSKDLYNDLSSRLQSKGGGDLSSYLVERTNDAMKGFDNRNTNHIDYAARIYAKMVEEDLIGRLKNGVYGRKFQICENAEIYRLMLSRSLKNDFTALLYVPVELLEYFAIRHHDDGIGKSLMDDNKIVNSLRSIVTLANIQTSIRNAISRTKVSTILDEDDEDPLTTMEKVKGFIVQSRNQGMPIGTSDPTEITSWLNMAGYEFEFSGNKGISEMKIDFSESASNHTQPDTDLEAKLRDKSIQGMGLTPELVDAGFAVEYATTAVANNLLLTKRVIQIQDDFLPHLSNYTRMCLTNSEVICHRLRMSVTENLDKILSTVPAYKDVSIKTEQDKESFVEFVIENFIDTIDVSLPRPNSATIESQAAYLEVYSKALDSVIDQYLNKDFLTSDTVGEEMEGKVDTAKAAIKAHYMRKEIAKIGLLPELSEIVTVDDKGLPIVKLYDELDVHINNMTKSLSHLMSGIRLTRNASDDVNKDKDSGGGSSSSDSDSSSDGGDDGDGGGDDFSFGGEDDDQSGDDGGAEDGDKPDSDDGGSAPEEKEEPEPEPES